jgi:site-specific DNA-methyltransferase (adenine-specific)
MSTVQLMRGDCLKRMQEIPCNSIDMILTDPPYGTTACSWDEVIPLEPMWNHINRVCKSNSAIVINASQPFTSRLIMSNLSIFKYEWIWQKGRSTGLLNAKIQPLRNHENILVFYKKQPTYNPQFTESYPYNVKKGRDTDHYNDSGTVVTINEGTRYPKTVQKFDRDTPVIHPTQKPVALMKYLIKTYTNEDDTVLDFTMGSGTTGVACVLTNRNFIGIELDEQYFQIAKDRIEHKQKIMAL